MNSSRGFTEGKASKEYSTKDLGVDFELNLKDFGKKEPFSKLIKAIVPRSLYRLGKQVYTGPRLLVKRGISRSGNKNGVIQARFSL